MAENEGNANGYVRWATFSTLLVGLTVINFSGMAYLINSHTSQPHLGVITEREYDKDLKDIKQSINNIEELLKDRRAHGP